MATFYGGDQLINVTTVTGDTENTLLYTVPNGSYVEMNNIYSRNLTLQITTLGIGTTVPTSVFFLPSNSTFEILTIDNDPLKIPRVIYFIKEYKNP